MTEDEKKLALHVAMLRGKRKPHNRFAIWWHFTVLNHQQWQWGVERPVGVPAIRREAVLCSSGSNWRGARR